MTQPGLEFGLVPHQVIADLRDIGNWKVGGTHFLHPLELCIWHPSNYRQHQITAHDGVPHPSHTVHQPGAADRPVSQPQESSF